MGGGDGEKLGVGGLMAAEPPEVQSHWSLVTRSGAVSSEPPPRLPV